MILIQKLPLNWKNNITRIVDRLGGHREKMIWPDKAFFVEMGTWNSDHKVLSIYTERDPSGHRDGFSVDLITKKICG